MWWMIRVLTRLRYESRNNQSVARVAVWPDEPCTRGHMTSAAVLHIESNEPNRRPIASKRKQSRRNTQFLTPRAVCCRPPSLLSVEAATATLHYKAAALPFMCSLAPPAPIGKLPVHSLALLRLSALGSPVHQLLCSPYP